jgi:arylsulfatase A-like enzyme
MKRIFVLTAVIALVAGCGPAKDISTSYNVVLISIDTLRADHLGCYGYDLDTSPNIDRFARDGIVFENAYSTAPKTPESHMSMFTSLYPSVHRVFTITDESKVNVLDSAATTFPEMLKQNGYTTVGIHGGGFMDGKFGFDRGFDVYRMGGQAGAERWLKENGGKNKFFLFYHTYHVHDPYTPRSPFDTMFDPDYSGDIVHDRTQLMEMSATGWYSDFSETFWSFVDKEDPRDVEHLVALYDGEIREMDTELGQLFRAIERYAPHTIVILLSDHGEEFGEHNSGFLHSQMYDETLHVPLIVKHPEYPGGQRISNRVSLVDLAPTILDMLSVFGGEGFQGEALAFYEGERNRAASIFSEYPLKERYALIKGNRKLIQSERGKELYDLLDDPNEKRDLTESRRQGLDSKSVLQELHAELTEIVEGNKALSVVVNKEHKQELLDEETLERLRALGYIK